MTVLAALARRASAEPEEPWLFYRRGWNWRWRSWGQVADQAVRGAEAVARSPGFEAPADVRALFDARQDPDAVAAGLAVRAAGATAVPRTGGRPRPLEVALLEGGEPALRLRLPACRSRLERWEPRPLDPEGAGGLAFGAEAPRVPPGEMSGEARRLEAVLPAPGRRRPILCASADLDPRTVQILQAWTVRAAAAWVLEPDPEDFQAAVLWSRPTLVVAGGEELERLAAALVERKHRRHHRLAAVVWIGEVGEREVWEDLGVPVIEWRP